ncbi:MAG: bifunctional riboflavin kinase/FAD synthetase [bacterium]
MRIIRHADDYDDRLKAVLTIGNFDGLHIGHQRLIKTAVRLAGERKNACSAVLTFNRHPLRLLNPQQAPVPISSFKQKVHLFKNFGIDRAIFLRFTRKLARMSAYDFIKEIIFQRLSACDVVVGSDFAFGRGRQGNVSFLKEHSREFGYRLTVLAMISHNEHVASSTAIRRLVGEGEMVRVKEMLGRPYSLEGHVAHGSRKGKALRAATATLKVKSALIPRTGVYAVYAKLADGSYPGVANIGFQPTFGENDLAIEAHLFDFDKVIYHQPMELFFLERIRGEISFPSPEALREQIQKDIRSAREICLFHSPADR